MWKVYLQDFHGCKTEQKQYNLKQKKCSAIVNCYCAETNDFVRMMQFDRCNL